MQSNPPSSSPRLPKAPKAAGDCAPVALVERARMLDALDQKLRLALPESLHRHCCLADVRSGRVVFLATSSAWAAKLRFHQNRILDEARLALGSQIKSFAVKVANLAPVPRETTRRKPLSNTAAEHLKAAATSLSDPELAALYLRLASLAGAADTADAE